MTSLLSGLGGPNGFGELVLTRGVNTSSDLIDISGVFDNGLTFGGTNYTGLRVSTNGYIYFSNDFSLLRSGDAITDFGTLPVIAPFFADVDTSAIPDGATPGGNSQGSGLVSVDQNPTTGTLTITWDDVGYADGNTDQLNAFQLILIDRSGAPGRSAGDFDIEFRYEDINWSVGNDDDGFADSPADDIAVVGLTTGTGVGDSVFELPGTQSEAGILALESTLGNTGEPGRWLFEVQNGQVLDVTVGTSLFLSGPQVITEGDAGSTVVEYIVTRSGDTSGILNVPYTVNGSGAAPADSNDVSGTLPANAVVSFGVGETQKSLFITVFGDTGFEPDETLSITLDPGNTLNDVTFYTKTFDTLIANDDPNSPPTAEDDAFSGDEESVISGNLLANNGSGVDSDPDGDPLTIVAVEGDSGTIGTAKTLASGATVTVNADGTFDYDPNGAFAGLTTGVTAVDSFTYAVSDISANTDTATVTVTLNGEDAFFSVNADITGIAEGQFVDSQQTFLVTRTGATQTSVSITYAVVGSGLAPVDAGDFASGVLETGTLDFAPGEETKTIALDINGDFDPEADETFTVSISDPVADAGLAFVTTPLANGTIVNDDGVVNFPGTDGKDKAKGTSADDVFDGQGGRDKFRGREGDDLAIGGDDRDNLRGDEGNDTLVGGLGDDKLRGGSGNDILVGGDGDDKIRGGDGNDTIDTGLGNDRIKADDGDDTILAGAGDDRIDGGDGNDTINGDLGNDRIDGDDGDDTIEGDEGNDFIRGGDGSDFLFGEDGEDFIFGDRGFDTLSGGAGADELYGGRDIDTLSGDAGNDLLDGGKDADTLDGGEGNDQLFGDDGDDTLIGGLGDDRLDGGDENDRLEGGMGIDILMGGDGDDFLFGGEETDELFGDDGNDTLDGGMGNDRLTGGFGSDTFVYNKGSGTQVVTDFNRDEDIINLAGYDMPFNPADFDRLILFQTFTSWALYLPELEPGMEIPASQDELQELPGDLLIFENVDFVDLQMATVTYS